MEFTLDELCKYRQAIEQSVIERLNAREPVAWLARDSAVERGFLTFFEDCGLHSNEPLHQSATLEE